MKPSQHRQIKRRTKHRAKAGTTLIEVLVCLVIMSIALLGMAALQAQSVAQQFSASSRAKLAGLSADIAERMRSNLTQTPSSGQTASNSAYTLSASWTDQLETPAAAPDSCQGLALSAAQRAVCDLASWRVKLREELPGGSAQICGNNRDGIALTLMWFDKQFRSLDLKTGRFTLQQSPYCDAAATTSPAAQTCCPRKAEVALGVRCLTTFLLP